MIQIRRLCRGIFCWLTFLISPFGWFVRGRFIRRLEPDRLNRGLVLILPGIEGRSFFNLSILQGMLDAGMPYALEIVDWTTGNKLLFLYHLRSRRRHCTQAQRLAERIAQYGRDYPGRPVWLVGHSGGGGIALLTAVSLPEDVRLTGMVLLAPAVSPGYSLTAARTKVEKGIWSFSSYLDFLFVGLGTTLCGTIDGHHCPAAGMVGFRSLTPSESNAESQPNANRHLCPPVIQVLYRPSFVRQFHLGGHFGPAHRVFIAEIVAPLLLPDVQVRGN